MSENEVRRLVDPITRAYVLARVEEIAAYLNGQLTAQWLNLPLSQVFTGPRLPAIFDRMVADGYREWTVVLAQILAGVELEVVQIHIHGPWCAGRE